MNWEIILSCMMGVALYEVIKHFANSRYEDKRRKQEEAEKREQERLMQKIYDTVLTNHCYADSKRIEDLYLEEEWGREGLARDESQKK